MSHSEKQSRDRLLEPAISRVVKAEPLRHSENQMFVELLGKKFERGESVDRFNREAARLGMKFIDADNQSVRTLSSELLHLTKGTQEERQSLAEKRDALILAVLGDSRKNQLHDLQLRWEQSLTNFSFVVVENALSQSAFQQLDADQYADGREVGFTLNQLQQGAAEVEYRDGQFFVTSCVYIAGLKPMLPDDDAETFRQNCDRDFHNNISDWNARVRVTMRMEIDGALSLIDAEINADDDDVVEILTDALLHNEIHLADYQRFRDYVKAEHKSDQAITERLTEMWQKRLRELENEMIAEINVPESYWWQTSSEAYSSEHPEYRPGVFNYSREELANKKHVDINRILADYQNAHNNPEATARIKRQGRDFHRTVARYVKVQELLSDKHNLKHWQTKLTEPETARVLNTSRDRELLGRSLKIAFSVATLGVGALGLMAYYKYRYGTFKFLRSGDRLQVTASKRELSATTGDAAEEPSSKRSRLGR